MWFLMSVQQACAQNAKYPLALDNCQWQQVDITISKNQALQILYLAYSRNIPQLSPRTEPKRSKLKLSRNNKNTSLRAT